MSTLSWVWFLFPCEDEEEGSVGAFRGVNSGLLTFSSNFGVPFFFFLGGDGDELDPDCK